MNIFEKLKNSRGFIPFFVLGDPTFEESLALIKIAIQAGADALELGLAFSDPIADGPIIQRASERALKHMNFERALDLIKKIREYSPIPMNLLTYANPLYRQGYESAVKKLKAAGMDGILVADIPMEEVAELQDILIQQDLKQTFLIAPNTPLERASDIHQQSTAFSYIINRLGITGMSSGVPDGTLELLKYLKHNLSATTISVGAAPPWAPVDGLPQENSLCTILKDGRPRGGRPYRDRATLENNYPQRNTPLVVGFGIHTPEQANALYSAGADAIIVGSKICQFIEELPDEKSRAQAIKNYITDFKKNTL